MQLISFKDILLEKYAIKFHDKKIKYDVNTMT